MEAHKEAIRKKQLSVPELPMTVRVTRINVVDIVPLHAVAPNSPFVQISMGHFKKRTTKAFAAGSCADWTDLGWTFDIVDSRATITFSVVSGSKKAGSVVLTVKELLEIPVVGKDIQRLVVRYGQTINLMPASLQCRCYSLLCH